MSKNKLSLTTRLSCPAAHVCDEIGDHEDVQRQGKKAGVKMARLFMELLKEV